ncbi:Transposase InsO and inactivated derivatives [Rhizobiales bacterium GAS191]|nr:Transposase InsO and inactivated derivatives [Rhizobiales bacterium GAS191]
MPFRELSIVDQREEFVRLALMPGANKRELCRRFGLSRSKAYKWLERYAAEGLAGLCDRSRRPHSSPTRTAAKVEAEVLRIRKSSNNAWGGRKIAHVLERKGRVVVPAASTITEILRRHGKLEQLASEHPISHQRFERATPNELWQMDFKGDFATGQGRCHPLTVLDDHSRYALGVAACKTQQDQPTRDRLIGVFRRYGLPDAMLMDNGSPWGDSGGGPFTAFSVWLLRLGVRVTHGRPYHPQTQGKDERFHRTLKAEALQGRWFSNFAECQRALDRWRHVYNHQRPHQALDFATPSERYLPSPRSFPEALPPIEYGPHDIIRKVDARGDISFKSRRIRLGKPFRGEPVALRPTAEDGVFSIHFCTHQIGAVDLRAVASSACGFVDIARAMPTSPTGPTTAAEQSNRI